MLGSFTISREDWSLHRKGEIDRERHRKKVREAIKKNITDIISEETIILSQGRKIIKVPMRSLDEYSFRFDQGKAKHAGQGQGGTQKGDLLGGGRSGSDRGPGAEDEPGVDYYEAEISFEELAGIVYEDLVLPNLRPSDKDQLVVETIEFNEVRKQGIASNVHRKRTILEAIKRSALQGHKGFTDITRDDLRYKTWETHLKHESSAVVLAMMDTSGSMGPYEKYIARSFYFWMVGFLRTKYKNVQIVFLSHHVEARESSEEEFFTRGAGGGTRCSSVYKLALDIVNQRYNAEGYNIYAFHFSDGDNLASDNDRCVRYLSQLLPKCNLVGYGEIEGAYFYTSTLRTALKRINDPRLVCVGIKDKSDIYPALKTFFSPKQTAGD